MTLGGYQQEGERQHRLERAVLHSQIGDGCWKGMGIPLPSSHTQSPESSIHQDPSPSMPHFRCPFASLQARDGSCREEKNVTAGLGSSLGPLTLYLWLQLYSGLYLLDMRVSFLWLL